MELNINIDQLRRRPDGTPNRDHRDLGEYMDNIRLEIDDKIQKEEAWKGVIRVIELEHLQGIKERKEANGIETSANIKNNADREDASDSDVRFAKKFIDILI